VKGFLGGGRDYDVGSALAVVTLPSGPVVASASDARCAVTDPAGGRQNVIDAPAPYHWEFCADAAIGRHGTLTLLARDAGDYDTGTRDRIVLVEVDVVSLEVVRRSVLLTLPPQQQGPGRLIALPGGLVALVRDGRADYVIDLRGPKPVTHRIPTLGYEVAVAGPDAFFVWGGGPDVARVTVSTGRVERTALHLPSSVTGVVRVP
jgi:hypothetical protein